MHILDDKSISLKAKGLYMILKYKMITKQKILKKDLLELSSDGIGSFDRAWKELKDKGYLIQSRSGYNNMVFKYKLKIGETVYLEEKN